MRAWCILMYCIYKKSHHCTGVRPHLAPLGHTDQAKVGPSCCTDGAVVHILRKHGLRSASICFQHHTALGWCKFLVSASLVRPWLSPAVFGKPSRNPWGFSRCIFLGHHYEWWGMMFQFHIVHVAVRSKNGNPKIHGVILFILKVKWSIVQLKTPNGAPPGCCTSQRGYSIQRELLSCLGCVCQMWRSWSAPWFIQLCWRSFR